MVENQGSVPVLTHHVLGVIDSTCGFRVTINPVRELYTARRPSYSGTVSSYGSGSPLETKFMNNVRQAVGVQSPFFVSLVGHTGDGRSMSVVRPLNSIATC